MNEIYDPRRTDRQTRARRTPAAVSRAPQPVRRDGYAAGSAQNADVYHTDRQQRRPPYPTL